MSPRTPQGGWGDRRGLRPSRDVRRASACRADRTGPLGPPPPPSRARARRDGLSPTERGSTRARKGASGSLLEVRKRQGGNEAGERTGVRREPVTLRGDRGRLSAGETSKGPQRCGEVTIRSPKRSEPQDRQRDATGPQSARGATRRGGERPRGRNETTPDGSGVPKTSRKVGREWTRASTSGSTSGEHDAEDLGPKRRADPALARAARWRGNKDLEAGGARLLGAEHHRRDQAVHAASKTMQGGAGFGAQRPVETPKRGAGNGES